MLVRRLPLSYALYCIHVEGVNDFPRLCYINPAHLYTQAAYSVTILRPIEYREYWCTLLMALTNHLSHNR
jgi:hypothetical protein